MIISNTNINHEVSNQTQSIFSIDKTVKNDKFFIATGSIDGNIKIWTRKTVSNYELVKTIKRHNGSITIIRFSKSGRYFASGADDGKLSLFKVTDECEFDFLYNLKQSSDITSLDFINDDFIVTGNLDGKTNVIDIYNHKRLHEFKDHTKSILNVKSVDNETFLTFSEGEIFLYKQSYKDNERYFSLFKQKFYKIDEDTSGMNNKISVQGNYIALGLQYNNNRHTVDVLDQNLNLLYSLVGHKLPVEVVSFNDNVFLSDKNEEFSVIACASQDTSISFWSTINPKPFLLIKDFTLDPILDMFWYKNTLVCASYDGVVKVVEFDNDELNCNYVKNKQNQLNLTKENILLEKEFFKDKIDEPNKVKEEKTEMVEEDKKTESNKSKVRKITPVSISKDNKKIDGKTKVRINNENFDSKVYTKTIDVNRMKYQMKYENDQICIFVNNILLYKLHINSRYPNVVYNNKYMIIYDDYVRIYYIINGMLVYPYIHINVTYIDLRDNRLLLADKTTIKIINLLNMEVLLETSIPEYKENISNVYFDEKYILHVKYKDELVLIYHKKFWIPINNLTIKNSIENDSLLSNNNDNDNTLEHLESLYNIYIITNDVDNVFGVGMKMVGMCARVDDINVILEVKLVKLIEYLISKDCKSYVHELLKRLNEVKNSHGFIDRILNMLK
ncbi:HIRA [Hepatospora eriocheir]|uniref:HIRA n=1 Tax=Hepatospora eriocheir TaxID=1081669 RepID=A0A1X0QHZ0_9MICR|nr:HIRA [Hepatospora eriocheir]